MNSIEDKVLFEATQSDFSLPQAKKVWESPLMERIDLSRTQAGPVGPDDGLGGGGS